MGQTVLDEFHEAIIGAVEHGRAKQPVKADDDHAGDDGTLNHSEADCDDIAAMATAEQSLADESPCNHGKLILDASVAEQAIRFSTDLGLLNEARELSEGIIDKLHAASNRGRKKKPRSYRELAGKAYLSLVKLKRPSNSEVAPLN